MAAQGLYPAIDPLNSASILLDPRIVGEEHYTVAEEVRRTIARYHELQEIISLLGVEELSAEDRLTVERLARLEDEAADLRAEVAERGGFLWRKVQSARGEVLGEEAYEHPACVALRRLGAEQAKLCEALGLTPAARARLGLVVVETQDRPDALDELRARRHRRRSAAGIPDPTIAR